MRNWAGNITFAAATIHHPESISELCRIVATTPRIRALGTGHSFSPIADTTGDLVAMTSLAPTIDIDPQASTVTVGAGIRYGELAIALDAAGYALRNLASLPHISVAGAVATGTHGSGDGNGNLATAVVALDLVTATGEIVTLRRGDPDFAGAVVALGALGIVSRITLAIVPTFEVAQYVYDDLPMDAFDIDAFAAGYSVSAFTTWATPRFETVWVKRRVAAPDPSSRRIAEPPPTLWRGARLADGPRHPVPGEPPDVATRQLGQPGRWHTRLPHFKLEFTPSVGDELQSEYFVAREHGVAAVAAVAQMGARIAPHLLTSEIRTIASDDLWLSPAYRRDSLAIHFTWKPDMASVVTLLREIDERLAPFRPRPHWGKVFTMQPAQIEAGYERLPDFGALRRRYDPDGKFANAYVNAIAPAR